MGRYSTGALTTGECLRINIADLINSNSNGKPIKAAGGMSWTSGANISYELNYHGYDNYLQLYYTKTLQNGEKKAVNYKVKIETVPSNLGKGENPYFLCPFSFKRCKILYMGYGSEYFKGRQSYKNRIYYSGQINSKRDRSNDRYWILERTLEKIGKKPIKSVYNGHPTKKQLRINRLTELRKHFDYLRWAVLIQYYGNI